MFSSLKRHAKACGFLVPGLLLIAPASLWSADYLPLAVGNSWQLNSPNISAPMTAKVSSVEQYGDILRARIDIENPWMRYSLLLKRASSGYELEGIALDSVRYRFGDALMYFPTTGVSGQIWNSSGTAVTLLSDSGTLTSPAGSFSGVRRYKIVSPDGSAQYWGLAPNVGFVEFGTGSGAFVASTFVLSTGGPPVLPPGAARNCPLVGIDANPAANGNFSEAGKDAALSFAKSNGSRFMHISTSWSELEPAANSYNLTALKAAVARAGKYGLDANVTLKTINTSSVSMPPDLAGKAWNDPVVLSRFRLLLSKVVPALTTRVRWLDFGNEVDVLLSAQPAATVPFAEFLQSASAHTAGLRPDLSTGVVFSGDSYRLNDFVFRALSPLSKHISFTYYATRANPTPQYPAIHRDVSDVPFDITELIRAAGGKPLVFTELGYSSATVIGSSLTAQRAFYQAVFDALRISGGNVRAANFFLMSDIPGTVATNMNSTTVALFTTWFQTLGIFDQLGAPKPAWDTFRTQASDFTVAGRCN